MGFSFRLEFRRWSDFDDPTLWRVSLRYRTVFRAKGRRQAILPKKLNARPIILGRLSVDDAVAAARATERRCMLAAKVPGKDARLE
jgi:hypothetical protein